MATEKSIIESEGTYEAECLECGIKLETDEVVEIDREILCGQCAEDYLRESEMHEPAASQEDIPESGARLH